MIQISTVGRLCHCSWHNQWNWSTMVVHIHMMSLVTPICVCSLARSLAWVGGTSGRTRDPLDRIAALDRSTYRPTCSSERVGTPYRSRKNAIDDAGRYEFCDSSNLQLSLWMDASEQHQGIPTYLPADVLHPPDFSALQSLGPVRSNRECNAMQCNAMQCNVSELK